ncbi:MAG TPA: hypothetical protein VGY55_18545 [Pirellulales bacterium]|jgi:hypothetical protein|nr:hypothetical protein [Pirellulales bacterium]
MRKKLTIGLLCGAAICSAVIAFSEVFGQERPEGPVFLQKGLVEPGSRGEGNVLYYRSLDGGNRRDAELNAKIDEQLHKYTAAKDDGERDAAKKQIQSSLTELFDIRQKEREEEIKQIEDRVAHLRDTLKKRESMRQELIDHHLTTLIQDAEGLGWGTEGAREKHAIMTYTGPGGSPAAVPPAVPGQIYRIPNALAPIER